jgi:hypothetical protein
MNSACLRRLHRAPGGLLDEGADGLGLPQNRFEVVPELWLDSTVAPAAYCPTFWLDTWASQAG